MAQGVGEPENEMRGQDLNSFLCFQNVTMSELALHFTSYERIISLKMEKGWT